MSAPTISVLMTAYNREDFIAEAIESVLASTFTDFELLIVDDASTDKTVEIAQTFAAKDSRINVVVNKKNLGQFANRNKAASYATGTYLKFVDSDDLIYPHTLASMLQAMQEFPMAAMGFCHTIGEAPKPLPFLVEPQEAFRQHYLAGGLLFIGPIGTIIKTTAFNAVGGFEDFGMPSDNHFSLKIAGAYCTVAMEPKLFYWRRHSNQVFTMDDKNHRAFLNNYNFSVDLLRKHSPLQLGENAIIYRNLKKIFFMNLIKLGVSKAKPALAYACFKAFCATNAAQETTTAKNLLK